MPPYADWSSSMQAYYGPGATPPFFASPVASPAPHPYMWAGQHPIMPPYSTPVHYPAIYQPGGVYHHPNLGTATNGTSGAETDGKHSDAKDQTSSKKSKGNSGGANEKVAETGKSASGSGNEGVSQSGESGSEGSSDGSDEDNNQQGLSGSKKGSFEKMLVEAANAQNSIVNPSIQASVPGKPVVQMAAANLNMGMDLWNSSSAGPDERELKRQKRKQSNRESARRSRLRKQAECEELQRRVQSLNNENSNLRDELEKLASECEKLTSANDSIKEELTRLVGPDALSVLGEKNLSGEANS